MFKESTCGCGCGNCMPHSHGSVGAEIINTLPDREQISIVSAAMKQLGDPVRLRIFWLLCHCEESVINIAEIMGMSSPAVFHHLKLLRTSKLISARRDGKEMYYRAVDSELVNKLHKTIEDIAEITCPKK